MELVTEVPMNHRKHSSLTSVSSIFVALMFCLVVASGQTITGRISGTVKDSSNAVVPGATVTVTNKATQTVRATFVFPYTIETTAPGTAAPAWSGTVLTRV